MTIPPEILEQIYKKANEHLEGGGDEGNSDMSFRLGAQFGYSLRQKQTPPPTGVIANPKLFSFWGTDGCTNCETGRITLFVANKKCMECDPESYKRQPDRDQKIAQAVEGLVLAAKGVNSWLASKKVYEEEPGSKKRILEIVDLTEALSKLEEAKK